MQDSLMREAHCCLLPHSLRADLAVRAGRRFYGIGVTLRIVRITSVVMLVVIDSFGGGGGSAAPGECIIPANAETVSVRLSATAAQLRLSLFIVVVLQSDLEIFASTVGKEMQNFQIKLDHGK